MKFKINNSNWKIVELDTKELTKRFNGSEDEFLYGFCSYTENIIYLNNMLVEDRKNHTPTHDATH